MADEVILNVVNTLRHDTSANWTTNKTRVLKLGEPGVVTDIGVMKIGDGVTPWNTLPFLNVYDSNILFSDITTGNASTSNHGFLPKLAGGTSKYLRADGTWNALSAISFKNISNATVTYSGLTPLDLTAGIYYAANASDSTRAVRAETAALADEASKTTGTLSLKNSSNTTTTFNGSSNIDLTAGIYYSITSGKLSSSRNFALTGAVTGTLSTDLSSGMSIATTIKDSIDLTGSPTTTTQAITDSSTKIATTAYVTNKINNIGNIMVMKGSLGTNGTITALPASHVIGDTYKVITAGTYGGQACEVGDLITCTTAGTIDSSSDWTIIQTNLNNTVSCNTTSADKNVALYSGTTGKILVPLGNGTSGQVLKMSEISGPQWGTDNNTEYIAGTGLKLVNTQFSLDASGVTAAAYGNVNDQTLTWGITFAVPYIHVDIYGRIISAESSIITMPAEPTTGTIVGGTATDIANATATNGNVYINHLQDGAVVNSHNIKGSDATSVTSDSDGAITVTTPNYYPTTWTWTNGTTAGPTATITGSGGQPSVSIVAVPSASATTSGVITTGAQTLKGVKTFSDGIVASVSGNATTSSNCTGNSATADKVNNAIALKINSGTTEGTDLYTFDGSSAKSFDLTFSTGLTTTTATGKSTITLATYGTAGTYGPTANSTLTYGGTFTVPTVITDAYGRVISTTRTMTMPASDDTNYYPTTFTWTNGTTAGPTGSLTGTGMSAVSIAAIPAASASVSGIITTGAQTIAGSKTFSSNIIGSITGNANTASTLYTSRTIDGISFNGSGVVSHYTTCATAAATAAKVAALANFSLVAGAKVTVEFTYTNTASSPTLNVNSTGAKSIYYQGVAVPAGWLAADRPYSMIYDGTNYEVLGSLCPVTMSTSAPTSSAGVEGDVWIVVSA